MGVVYHANYLVWCEIGRTELIRALGGVSYAQLEEEIAWKGHWWASRGMIWRNRLQRRHMAAVTRTGDLRAAQRRMPSLPTARLGSAEAFRSAA